MFANANSLAGINNSSVFTLQMFYILQFPVLPLPAVSLNIMVQTKVDTGLPSMFLVQQLEFIPYVGQYLYTSHQ